MEKHKSKYLNFIKKVGISMADINLGSNEIAINIEDSLKAIELLKEEEIEILGGDILVEVDERLVYAYQCLGEEYIYLNWFYEEVENDSYRVNVNKSYFVAKEKINIAKKIINKNNKKGYVVIIANI